MFDIVLVHPEIPPNTGNSIRLSANAGARLHLVEPLGFHFADKQLERAGLDYHDLADVRIHTDWDSCRAQFAPTQRLFAFSSQATTHFHTVAFQPGDVFVFGRESTGLEAAYLEQFDSDRMLRVPMRPARRSINLSNTVAIVVYEAWRQQGFAGGV